MDPVGDLDEPQDEENEEESVEEIEQKLDQLLVRFFRSVNVSSKEVENEYFLNFIKLLGDIEFPYRVPNRHALAESILKNVNDIYVEEKRPLLRSDSILMVNTWKNERAKKEYIIFTLTNLNLTRTFLSFKSISLEDETVENLGEMIQEAINLAGSLYKTKVCGIITDEDEKLIVAASSAKSTDGHELLLATCSSSSAKSLIKSFVDYEQLGNVKSVISLFKKPRFESMLLQDEGTKLQNFTETRFFHVITSCQCICDNWQKLREICQRPDVVADKDVRNVMGILNDPEFETWLCETVLYLNPICDLIKTCQEPKANVADAVQLWISLRASDNVFQHEIEQWMMKADQRGTLQAGYLANILHQKYRGSALTDDQIQMANDYLISHFPEAHDEFCKYLADYDEYRAIAISVSDPIDFWSLMDPKYPKLGKCALKLMILPASTALSEELFSSCTNVHNIFSQHRILDDRAAYLMNIHFSIKLDAAPCDEFGYPLDLDND